MYYSFMYSTIIIAPINVNKIVAQLTLCMQDKNCVVSDATDDGWHMDFLATTVLVPSECT